MICFDLIDKTTDSTRLLVEALTLIVEAAKKAPLPSGWKHIQRYLSDEERTHQRKDMVQKMLDIFRDLPSDKEFEAAARAGEAKKGWYSRSAKTLQDVFGPDTPRFTALLASTSPQVSVKENLRVAMRLWEAWIKAGRPDDPKEIDKVGDGVLGARWSGGVTLDDEGKEKKTLGMGWKNNATLAFSHPHPEKVTLSSGGMAGKVDSFRANLLGDLSRVTNDAWMASFAGISQNLFGSPSGYYAYSAKIRKVAEKMGWKPAEVQETIWSFFKALTESGSMKTGHGREALKNLTHGDVGDSVDFYDLMLNDPEVKNVIERLRAGGHVGSASPELRDGGPDPAASPYAQAEEGGFAGELERIADRSGEYRRIEDLQTNATSGWSFPKAEDVRLTGTTARFTLTDPRDIAEYKEKSRQNTVLILPSKKPKHVEVLYGAKQAGGGSERNHTEVDGKITMSFVYERRETVRLSDNPNRQIDWDQWRYVEKKKKDRFISQQRKAQALANREQPTAGGFIPPLEDNQPE